MHCQTHKMVVASSDQIHSQTCQHSVLMNYQLIRKIYLSFNYSIINLGNFYRIFYLFEIFNLRIFYQLYLVLSIYYWWAYNYYQYVKMCINLIKNKIHYTKYMQPDLQAKSTPIHNNINRKGILRRFDRKRLQKQDLENDNNNLKIEFVSCMQYEIQKAQMKTERASVLSSIRCRNIRNRKNQNRKKEIHSLRQNNQDPSGKLQHTYEGAIISAPKDQYLKDNYEIKMFLSKKTAPVRLIFSRSRTSRTHYSQKKQYPNFLQVRGGLVGYQINNTLMNRKISVFTR